MTRRTPFHLSLKRAGLISTGMLISVASCNRPIRQDSQSQLSDSRFARKRQLYDQAFAKARAAIESQPPRIDRAKGALDEAESFLGATDASRMLRVRLDALWRERDFLREGEQRMEEFDYERAKAAFEQASQVNPTEENEKKFRKAAAYVLLEEARAALKNGDTQKAESKLRNSVWYAETPEAMAELAKLK